MALSILDQLAQLDSARQIVLQDPSLYPQIVGGILPIVGANARLELQRWGAEFLSETFASPVVAAKSKEQMGITVLPILKDLLEAPGEPDTTVIKGVILASAGIYGFVFKYIIDNPSDIPVWNNMLAIKANILKRWDSAAIGVRMCCIKFVQKVVEIQSPGPIADPRRPEKNETSIAVVPRDHALIPPSKLEPEASGLLDRLLDVFQNDNSDAVLVNATLNCMTILIRNRQSIANKIISAILNFNPLKRANSPMTPKLRVQIKSMERTTRALLLNFYRRNENSPVALKIKSYVERMAQGRMEILDDGASRKRALPHEPTDGLDNSKRRRLGAEIPAKQGAPLQLNGPNSVAQLFTLTNDKTLATFDVRQLPEALVVQIATGLLAHVNQTELTLAVNAVRARLLTLEAASRPPALGDDEEDYEPDFAPNEDREQILNRADALPSEETEQADVALGPFKLPPPPSLSKEEAGKISVNTVDRVFSMINVLEESAPGRRRKQGLNRLAGSSYDREAWLTFVIRMATRGSAGLYDNQEEEHSDEKAIVHGREQGSNISESIRDTLWRYVMEDFRVRISVAIAWLNEEWFNDKLQEQAFETSEDKGFRRNRPKQNYEMWTLKILDSMMPYLDAKDNKVLIRFLSEIPFVTEQVVGRVKSLARDPERVDLCVKAIHYLILMKPPAREMCIDALDDLRQNYDDARAPSTKLLQKWRPEVLPAPAVKVETQSARPDNDGTDPRAPSSSANTTKAEEIRSPTTSMPVAAAG